jgi:hypothetical protein
MATSKVCNIRTGRIAIQEQRGTATTNSQRSPSVSHTPIAKSTRSGLTGAGLMALILRQAPAGIVVCDGKRNVTLVNAAARKLVLNGPEGEPITYVPDIWGEMLDPDGYHIPAEESPCMKALLGQTTNGQECCFVRPGDGSFDVLFSATPITSDQKVIGMIATLFDITQHNDEELQLREDAVSNERNRMAADLHDTLCQSLSAIMLMLNAAEHELADEPEKARSHFRCAHEVAFESLAEARRTMWTLSHESLENEDLAPALSLELRRELLRIAREALANVLKHSNATRVHLDLVYQKREVQLSIFDDGHGFVGDPRPGTSHGAGLNNMRKRAERMGGKLIVNSLPGQGTRLIAALPLSMSLTDRFATESAEHLGTA